MMNNKKSICYSIVEYEKFQVQQFVNEIIKKSEIKTECEYDSDIVTSKSEENHRSTLIQEDMDFEAACQPMTEVLDFFENNVIGNFCY